MCKMRLREFNWLSQVPRVTEKSKCHTQFESDQPPCLCIWHILPSINVSFVNYFNYSKSTASAVLMEILLFILSWQTKKKVFQVSSCHSKIFQIGEKKKCNVWEPVLMSLQEPIIHIFFQVHVYSHQAGSLKLAWYNIYTVLPLTSIINWSFISTPILVPLPLYRASYKHLPAYHWHLTIYLWILS